MKITSFNPMIVAKDPVSVIQLYESLGFLISHRKEGIADKDISSVRMKNEDGFHVDIATGDFPQDRVVIRMNVNDLEEACEMLMARGFKRAKNFSDTVDTPSSRFCILVSPSGFAINVIQHMEEKEKLKEDNRKLKRIINALMNDYTTVMEVNFLTGDTEFFCLDDQIMSRFGLSDRSLSCDEMMALFFANGVFEEDREEVQSVFNPAYLLTHLRKGSSINRLYRNDRGIYVEIKAVRTGEKSVLFGFTNKDKEVTEQKEHLFTDSLTQVKNRRYYDDCLASQTCHALVMADVDHFKDFNDTYGHKCGDEVLTAAAGALQANVREEDTVVRYGGDEFLIAFGQITPEALQERMETIRQAVEKIRILGYPLLRLTMSFGVVFGTGRVYDMMKEADNTLYKAKEKRNTVIIVPLDS